MPTPVIMPKVDMDQEKATIISWEKKEGEAVKQDETILTVETEKVAIDVTSPATGILAGIKFQAGDVVPVATVIAQILKPGETLADQTAVTPPSAVASAEEPVTLPTPAAPVQASPLALRVAQELGVGIEKVPASKGKVSKEDVEAYVASLNAPVRTTENLPGKIAATPAARRIAEETGVPLETIKGSGPFGRIQAVDVKPSATSPVSSLSSSDRPAEIIPLIGIRAKIAQRMQSSFQQAPHIAETVEADISRLEDAKVHLNEIAALKSERKVSLTAILVKLTAWVLERHPYINSSLIDEKIHLWKDINIGVATALDDGLIVPVVHGANKLSFGETAEKLNDLSRRAREGKLELGEVQRGTFTISNLGMFGIRQFRAVINPPESAILAIGAAVRKPIVIDDRDTVVVRPVIAFTLSADHRVIDGVVAARFLADLVKVVEHPEILLV